MAYDDRPAWARRLRQARISKGWSQRKLAQKLEARAGATERALPVRESLARMIRGWEAGDHLPEPFHRWLLAQVLDIAEEELFEPSDGTLVMVSARGISTAQWSLLTRIAAALQRLKGTPRWSAVPCSGFLPDSASEQSCPTRSRGNGCPVS
jgi:transcriptional regulator with XRE-family HTH domain